MINNNTSANNGGGLSITECENYNLTGITIVNNHGLSGGGLYIDMLSNVDYPCVVRSSYNPNLVKEIDNENVILSESSAPEGWKECVNNVFSKILIGAI